MWVAKVGSAREKIGRAGLFATVQQKPVGGFLVSREGRLGYSPVQRAFDEL